MKEVQQELSETCSKLKDITDYYYIDYCFLEVLPPYIEQGFQKCLNHGIDSITIVPLFLYPGMKLKNAITQTASLIIGNHDKKVVFAKPLSYQPAISEIVHQRVSTLIKENNLENSNFSVILIGHGSSDKRAKDAFLFTVDNLKSYYKNVTYCFLELESPNIDEGIKESLNSHPDSVLIIPYFLHKGIHIQKDIQVDVDKASEKYDLHNLYYAEHLGVDPLMVNLISNLANEAEEKSGLF